ncbi:MAG: hypothetical protein KAR11_03665 [Phycisphaerae bacterium]|nr:hypothetical protein [Phycisphaerae bacterium]
MTKMNNNTAGESVKSRHMLLRVTLYLPLLLGPVAVCAMIIFYNVLCGKFPDDASARLVQLDKWINFCELIAPWMLAATLAVYWCKAIYTRNLTYVVISAITACLLLRELHWDHTIKIVIFPLLGFCFVWMLIWRDLVDAPTANWWHTIFFIAALATYGFGQLIEKRVFKSLPFEGDLHTQMEETVECTAHLLLFMAAVFGSWQRKVISVTKKKK